MSPKTDINLSDIRSIVKIAGVNGFNDEFQALGGGEVNDTYKISINDGYAILRIAKDQEQRTLENEARALKLLDSPYIPQLIYFNEHNSIKNRLWILESCIGGTIKPRLTEPQFNKLGQLLAQVHSVKSSERGVNLWRQFLDNCKSFGDEELLLNHPHEKLKILIRKEYELCKDLQISYNLITPSLIHLDATPSNILVDGDKVGLIDWEFSKFNDSMSDFSTVYYEDVEYNLGKWRIKITSAEKDALFSGYETAGGSISEDRIRFWIQFDKLGAAVFLYWRLNHSKRNTSQIATEQYQFDFENLLASLSN
jgi:Ser/Thr protein kinase RdoA (MazF antagonist)